jgi:GDP-L-fucose synthase
LNKTAKIYIPGHRGLVGSAIVRKLQAEGYNNLITRSRDELDLHNQASCPDYLSILINSRMLQRVNYLELHLSLISLH